MQESISKVDEVERLLQRADDAPTYGINARELILQAARQASSAGQGEAPAGRQQHEVQPCSGETAEMLVNSLTVHEKPLVQYINRSAVPRVTRQGLANRLAGQHLAFLLQKSGLPVTAAALQSTEASMTRKSGVVAALAQELSIYRKSNTKLAYMHTAARTSACPSFLPAPAESKTSSGPSQQHEAAVPGAAAAQHQAAGEAQGSKQHLEPRERGEKQSKQAKKEQGGSGPDQGNAGAPGQDMVLQEDDIGWDDDGEQAAGTAGTSHKEVMAGEGALLGSVHAAARHQTRATISRPQEEYSPSNSLDVQEMAFNAPIDDRGNADSLAATADEGRQLGAGNMRRAVLRFVRAILDPLHQCKVISRDVYRQVAKKAVDKIVLSHADAPDASFLVTEASKVQRLVTDYIQHVQSRRSP